MISKINQEKVRKFYDVVAKMQTKRNREMGLLVVERETLGDIAALALNSNLVTSIELSRESDLENVINQMADAVRQGRIILIRLYDFLDPKIYNQLFLLTKDGHMEYPHLEERVFVDAADSTLLILLATDADLEKLNYPNILQLAGVVERL